MCRTTVYLDYVVVILYDTAHRVCMAQILQSSFRLYQVRIEPTNM